MGGDRKQPVLRKAVARPDDGPKDSATADAPLAADEARRSVPGGVPAHLATGNAERVGLDAADTSAPSAVVGAKALRFTPALSLFVRGQPETQGSLKIVGRGAAARIVDSNGPALARWRNNVQGRLMEAWRPRQPLAGALALEVTFYIQAVAGVRKIYPWMRDPETGMYWVATNGWKDTDKLARAIGDAAKLAGVVADDGLIVDLHSRKFWASPPDTPPGVQIELRVL